MSEMEKENGSSKQEKSEKEKYTLQQQLEFANIAKMKLLNLHLYPYQNQTRLLGSKYKKEDIEKALRSPEIHTNQNQLRMISRFLYNASSHYKRLVNYFSQIPVLSSYTIEPYNSDVQSLTTKAKKDKFKKSYIKTSEIIENMTIEHEFQKLLPVIFREDIVYAYVHETEDSFFFQVLDSEYCKISSISDGVYNFSFNFSYFNNYPARLDMFPDEFKIKYRNMSEKNGDMWQELDNDKTLCLKYQFDLWYPIPPFVNTFPTLIDIEDFKALRKNKEEIDNYKILLSKIPMGSKEADDFLLTLDRAMQFNELLNDSVPDQVATAISPMDFEVITFDKDKIDKNRTAEATSEYWSEAGVSDLLFSSSANNSTSLSFSVKTDEAMIFSVMRQIERWINRYIKNKNIPYKFKFRFLDVTVFNQDKRVDQLLKQAQYGMPVKADVAATLGMSPNTFASKAFLENEILKLHDLLIPLSSSHTQSKNDLEDKAGRRSKSDDELSASGVKTRENDANANRDNANI